MKLRWTTSNQASLFRTLVWHQQRGGGEVNIFRSVFPIILCHSTVLCEISTPSFFVMLIQQHDFFERMVMHDLFLWRFFVGLLYISIFRSKSINCCWIEFALYFEHNYHCFASKFDQINSIKQDRKERGQERIRS